MMMVVSCSKHAFTIANASQIVKRIGHELQPGAYFKPWPHAKLVSMKVVAVIPARLASTRLPRKMLREIAGVPLLARVYQGVRRSSELEQVIVATDSEEILRFCEQQGFAVRMTSPTHRSGTERVHEISTAIPADVYLNVQGDEPLTRPEHIESLVAVMRNPEVEVGTLENSRNQRGYRQSERRESGHRQFGPSPLLFPRYHPA